MATKKTTTKGHTRKNATPAKAPEAPQLEEPSHVENDVPMPVAAGLEATPEPETESAPDTFTTVKYSAPTMSKPKSTDTPTFGITRKKAAVAKPAPAKPETTLERMEREYKEAQDTGNLAVAKTLKRKISQLYRRLREQP